MRIGSVLHTSSYASFAPLGNTKEDSKEVASEQGVQKAERAKDDPEVKQEVAKLISIDAKVRSHEAAHQAAGGGYAGAASFEYAKGPDGKEYAIAGEVPIDTSSESTPEATAAKMEQVKAAALAPGDPSPQDLKVASQAAIMATKAKIEASEIKKEESAKENQDKTAVKAQVA